MGSHLLFPTDMYRVLWSILGRFAIEVWALTTIMLAVVLEIGSSISTVVRCAEAAEARSAACSYSGIQSKVPCIGAAG